MKPFEPIVVGVTLRASSERVWRAISDGTQMPGWFFATIAEFRPEVGFQTRFLEQR
jgi:uncharacterized protein YndB with AHSA1/START domain